MARPTRSRRYDDCATGRVRAIELSDLRPGAALAGPVMNPAGLVLLQPSVVVTERHLALLRQHGLSKLLTDDRPRPPDAPDDVIEGRVRGQAGAALLELQRHLDPLVEPLRGLAEPDAARLVPAGWLRDRAAACRARWAIEHALAEAAEALMRARSAVRGNTTRAHDDGPIVHATDTTAVALTIGRHLHLPWPELRRLATGCLLHDVGMLAMPPELLAAGRIGPAGRSHLRLHAAIGYQLLRGLRPGEIVANHVAYQHHERQDGAGYPRGLPGTNRVGRPGPTSPGRPRPRLLLEAEVVAVADVYVALSARRPYRPPLPLGQAAAALTRLAGRHLNREVVAALIELLGIFPLGQSVLVRDGRYAHHKGMVSRVHAEVPDRPTVRLFVGPGGRITPIDVDFRHVEGAIAPLPIPLAAAA